MEIIIILGVILFLAGFITIICSCVVSGWKSREEKEQYKNLDTKKLDDETYWDENIYDEDFVKKEDENEKRDNLGK